jgi:hypothetical protein
MCSTSVSTVQAVYDIPDWLWFTLRDTRVERFGVRTHGFCRSCAQCQTRVATATLLDTVSRWIQDDVHVHHESSSLSVINEVTLIEETKASADTHTAWPMLICSIIMRMRTSQTQSKGTDIWKVLQTKFVH